MDKYTAIEKSDYINEQLKKYIKSTFQIDDPEFSEQFDNQLEEVELMKGPYISAALPFVTGRSIEDFVKQGVLSEELLKMDSLKVNRPLYAHQDEAILKSNQGKNLIISTGTGSGKTESFLIPILNGIVKDIQLGKSNRGVQALLIYPMNALANDQRKRLREILRSYQEITFGFYTGETKETEKEAKREYIKENNTNPLKNEIISREVIRKTPPNILFTNYSMLEYILLRPSDTSLFTSNNTKNWKYIVLDEAHTYRGSLGIEISYLIRRLLGNIDSKPKFILTSATLVNEKEDLPAVVEFAKKLTSGHFDEDSIVLAKRKSLVQPLEIETLSSNQYKDLFLALENKEISQEELHRIIVNDKNYYNLVRTLKNPVTVKDVIIKLQLSMEDITNLINIISFINTQEHLFLVDIRYHTFFRTLEGGFVTLKPEKTLHLKRISEYSLKNRDEKIQAFELGLCKYCKSGYLVGKIIDNKFYNVDDEILYEQFSPELKKEVDILLVKELADSFEIDWKDKRKFNLCNKCGTIYEEKRLNASKCTCGDEFKIETIMYDEKKGVKTNLYKCMCCNSTNTRGVVESFYVGKDTASSIVAQFLYKKMGLKKGDELVSSLKHKSFNPFAKSSLVDDNKESVKQFLAFSDSRQQASFFATYFDEMHKKFLRKRLILDGISNQNEPVTLKRLVEILASRIEKDGLFSDGNTVELEAWATVLIELLDIDRKFSLTGLGLISFTPKLELNGINEENVKASFDGLSKTDFTSLLKYIITAMRSIPAIDYSDASFTYDQRVSYFDYRSTTYGGLLLNGDENSTSLLPKNKAGNRYTDYFMKALNIDIEKAKEYLQKILTYLVEHETGLFVKSTNTKATGYLAKAESFLVQDGKNVKWYQCEVCKTLTDINVNDACVKSKCKGKLVVCIPNEIHKNNFYYSEYKTKEIEKIRIEEHTAQLDKEKAREYQGLFVNGKINILSSSTTFEMGVDIGTLDTVYMRNVPPTPANYSQRAGRAGRRNNTAAYCVTFCSSSSHDFSYFNDPIKMIEGKIKPPYFETNNRKIKSRHILSVALSMFFKQHPQYFENIDQLVFGDGYDQILQFLSNKPLIFVDFIKNNGIEQRFSENYSQWLEEMICESDSSLKIMMSDIKQSFEQLKEYRDSLRVKEENTYTVTKSINNLKESKTLDILSRYNVIPKYGFPIDTVQLQVPFQEKYELQRDLTSAISEYAPDSEILVDKNKYKSRYIKINSGSVLPKYFYKICKECNNLTFSLNEHDIKLRVCSNCEYELSENANKFLKPVNGFITEVTKMSDKSIKPKRTYSGDTYYVGDGISTKEIEFGETIKMKSTKDGRLAILNENPFFVCESCGYSIISHDNVHFNSIDKEHDRPSSKLKCENKLLYKTSLGHEYLTDVVTMEFVNEKFDLNELLSMMYAILEGISFSLEIEINDISGLVQKGGEEFKIVFYDNVPGGAGHVKRLMQEPELRLALNAALEKVSKECCDESSSCYNCLRNYRNQRQHPYIKRGLARNGLVRILNRIEQHEGLIG